MKYLIAAVHRHSRIVQHCPQEFSSEEDAVKFADEIYNKDFYDIKLIHIDGERIVKVAPVEKAVGRCKP